MRRADQPEDLHHDLMSVGQGDRAAFQRLYQSSAAKLFPICLGITRDRSAAEDVLQDVYIKVWRSAASYDPTRSSPLTWLGRIARNTAIDWYRSRPSRTPPSGSEAFLQPDEPEPVDQRMIRERSEDAALLMVADLSIDEEDQLKTIYLRGLTYGQLAAQTGVSPSTLKSRVRRTLARLRQKLEDE